MSIIQEKRHKAYKAIYGSDIFNVNSNNKPPYIEKPRKKMLEQSISPTTQIKLFGHANSTSNIHSNQSIPHKESRPIEQCNKPLGTKDELEHIKHKTSYERYLLEFHNTAIESSQIANTKGFLKAELKHTQPITKQHLPKTTNRIESLKSNIFNSEQKESDNNNTNAKENKIARNNWNTNLDWKNSKSELLLKNQKSTNDSIAQCQTLDDYYNAIHNKNILSHKFKVFPAEKLETVQLEKECKEQGIHIYNVEKHSDWLNGHGSQMINFDIRENDLFKFKTNFTQIKEKLEKDKGININFISCNEVSEDETVIPPQQQTSNNKEQMYPLTSYSRPSKKI